MKNLSLQTRYSIAQGLYWAAGCALFGFVAVFLKEKGLGNTEIGLTVGLASLASCCLSPLLSSLAAKHNKISIQEYLILFLIITMILFCSLSLFALPAILTMVLFGLLYCLNVSTNPFLSQMVMNYSQEGKRVDFGSARGIGSISYAIAAVVLGQLISGIGVHFLGLIYMIGMAALILLLQSMPKTYPASSVKKEAVRHQTKNKEKSFITRYPLFFILLTGFSLCFMVSSCMSTYMINIIDKIGMSQSLLGVCLFMMAASELPMMMMAPRLKSRFGLMPVLLIAALAYGVRNICIATADSMMMLIIGLIFHGMSYGVFTALITDYAGSALAAEDRMLGQSWIAISTTGIGGTIGNLFGGMLQDVFGLSVLLKLCIVITVIGIMIAVSGILRDSAFSEDLTHLLRRKKSCYRVNQHSSIG
ncbi:MFS transporter [Ileibacterium valens]|uniref:MFS transporter n=1 Tax=Ileibacterium valens TaxID=1862668 RepID=UPI00272DA0B3|nr:MFS transporter [Ileibacterium valens]